MKNLLIWFAVILGVIYGALHLVVLAALVTFGQRAGGYPLNPLAVLVYATAAAVGMALALWHTLGRRGEDSPVPILPLLALGIFLSLSLPGLFFATESLPRNLGDILTRLGLHAAYTPYLDDDGAFAWQNVIMAIWMVALSLAARWRALLVVSMAAQGLALWLNPGLILMLPATVPLTLAEGVHPDLLPLLAVPVLYVVAAVVLDWRGWKIGLLPVVPATFIILALAVLTIGKPISVLYWPLIVSLPVLAWTLRCWAATGSSPGRITAAGAGLALLAVVTTLSWSYLGPAEAGDNLLPMEGKTMGWTGATVPEDAYGSAGDILQAAKGIYPWLLAAAGLAWLASLLQRVRELGIRATTQAISFPGWLVVLGFIMLFQIAQFTLMLSVPLPVYPFAGALPVLLNERGLSQVLSFGYPGLGLALLGLGAALRHVSGPMRGWLTWMAIALALLAVVFLSVGVPAGALQNLETQQRSTLPEYRQAAQLRLALSLPVNTVMAVLGWVAFVSGLRAIRRSRVGFGFCSSALRRGLAAGAGIAVLAGAVFWQVTAMPVAETYPRDGASDVPTNASVMIQLSPAERNWGPGISARYADTGERVVQGHSGGMRGGGSWFAPKDGWRPNARVEVQVCCGPFTRSYRFSFTTGAGSSPDVPAPPGPPGPTPARPAPTGTGN